METITFYSYKGGVGRSLLLANMATFLAREGKRVVALDLDLEAPGLHYKFGLRSQKSSGQLNNGVVRYLIQTQSGQSPALKEYMYHVEENLSLIPAGNPPSPDYPQKLWELHTSLYSLRQTSLLDFDDLLIDLKETIYREQAPDFLLIDARTGVTHVSGIALNELADKVVVLMLNNDENLEGCRATLRGIKARANRFDRYPPTMIPVLTRLPYTSMNEAGRFATDLKNFLQDLPEGDAPVTKLSDDDFDKVLVLHSQPSLQSQEELLLNGSSTLRESMLLRDYIELFADVVPDVLQRSRWWKIYQILHNERLNSRPELLRPLVNGQTKRSVVDHLVGPGAMTNVVSKRLKVVPPRYKMEKGHFQTLGDQVAERLAQSVLGAEQVEYLAPEKPGDAVKRVFDYDLLGVQMEQGIFHFYQDGYYLTSERGISVGVVQFGSLLSFTCCIFANSILHELFSDLRNEETFEDTLKKARERLDQSEKICAAVLGETAATSASVQGGLLTYASTLQVLPDEEAMKSWMSEMSGQPHIHPLIVCDHVVLRRLNQLGGGPFASDLSFSFPHPVPVGFMFPKNDQKWRRHISSALSQVLQSRFNATRWNQISKELRQIGIDTFSYDDLLFSLTLDLTPNELLARK